MKTKVESVNQLKKFRPALGTQISSAILFDKVNSIILNDWRLSTFIAPKHHFKLSKGLIQSNGVNIIAKKKVPWSYPTSHPDLYSYTSTVNVFGKYKYYGTQLIYNWHCTMLCGPYLQIILKHANLSFLHFTFRLDIWIDKLFNGNRSYC